MAEDGGGYKGTFPRECLIQIFSQLPPASLALCMVVNKQWRDILVAEEGIWRDRCRVVYGYHGDGQHSSFRALCGLWHPICAKYGVMALSMLHSFGRIKAWLAENAPQVAESLRPGATEADIAQAEAQLDVKFPAPLRILYRIYDGQELEFDRLMDMRRPTMGPSVFQGLFGGYSFYSHLVSVRFLPLSRMVTRTLSKFQRRSVDKRVVFATSFDNGKLLYCDTFDGDVFVGGFPAIINCDNVPTSAWLPEALAHWAGYGAMPVGDVMESSGVLGSSATKNHLQKYMHLLYWMYQYANTLQREASMQLLHKDLPFSRGICLFPRSESRTSTCVTRGIRVKASPLFIPELSNPDECDLILFFAYSIKFELLDEATQQQEQELLANPEVPLKSVQLLDRRWIIRDKNGEIESEVRGEGVIGEYPILLAGGDPFAYQSCTNIRNGMRGTMEGEFTFVEGTLAAPGSREIKAICERFTLEWPSVIF